VASGVIWEVDLSGDAGGRQTWNLFIVIKFGGEFREPRVE
jgi:hypothetical protein